MAVHATTPRQRQRALRLGHWASRPAQGLRSLGDQLGFHTSAYRAMPRAIRSYPKEIIRLLAERPGQVFSRLEIMEELWQSEFSGDVRACDVHISNLRQKVERDPQEPELVLTVRGVGYKLAEG